MTFGWTTIKGWFGGGGQRRPAAVESQGNPAVDALPAMERRRLHLLGQIDLLERQLAEVRRSIVPAHLSTDPDALYALKQRLIRARDLRLKRQLLTAELLRHDALIGADDDSSEAQEEEPIPAEVIAVVDELFAGHEPAGWLVGTVVERAVRRLIDPQAEARWKAVEELRRLREPELLPLFTACLAFDDELLRAECLQALVELGEERATDALEELLDAPLARQRLAALRGINSIGAPNAAAACLRCLVDVEPELRRFAAVFLGWQKLELAAPALATTLRDERLEVRLAAAEALAAIRDESSVFALIRVLGDPELAMRSAARQALASLLGTPLEIDVDQEPRQLELLVSRLTQWWADARVDGRPWRTPVAYVTGARAAAGSAIVPLFTGGEVAGGRAPGSAVVKNREEAAASSGETTEAQGA